MNIKELQANWNEFGKSDPFYAILTREGKENNNWDLDEFFASGKKEIDDLMKYLRSLDAQVPGKKALDFGCGVGRLTQALAGHFEEVCGVDIAPSMIEVAQGCNRYEHKCTYYVNANDELSLFSDNSFDLIYSNITLQHMAPRYSKNYIRELVRILAPSGLLIFQLPGAAQTSAEPADTASLKIRKMIPLLLNAYRKLRYRRSKPIMQMYAVKKTEVVHLLEERGMEIMDIVQEPMKEQGWVSLRYCVRKPGRT